MALFNPELLVQQLCARWPLPSQPAPNPNQLLQVVEAAYLASMSTEEGRSLKFGLILLNSHEADDEELRVTRFRTRRPLNADEIRRLAPATNVSSTFIAVESNEVGAFIWGTVDSGSGWTHFQRGAQPSGIMLPINLVITVSGPGTLGVRLSDIFFLSA